MKITQVEKKIINEKVRLIGIVQVDNHDEPIELYFEYPQKFSNFVSESSDAFVPTLLLPSMEKGENLQIKPPVSEKLIFHLNIIQDIFHKWYPEKLKKIIVLADAPTKHKELSSNQVGSFFSLGVDSFYTLHKHITSPSAFLPSISHLIHVKGLECPLDSYKDNEEVLTRIREVAKETNTNCIFGETNIRSYFPLDWGPYYHGAGLASVALSLSEGLKFVLIPSSDSYKYIFPWGSSPLLDHWWSTEKTAIFHDGSELERAEKTVKIIEEPLAMKYLRVCLHNAGSENNCGKCSKCVRTMVPLYLSGKLAMFKTFPEELPKDWVKVLELNDEHYLSQAAPIMEISYPFADKKALKALDRGIKNAKYEIFFRNQRILNIFTSGFYLFLIKPIITQINKLQKTRQTK